ncbi:MAG: DinB family protein [Vicinamibacterales bacterium]
MSEPLPAAAQPIALLFKINNSMVTRGLEGLSDEDAWYQMEGKANPIAWMLGHLTETRAQLLGMLGTSWDPGWGGRFKRGSERMDRSAYPTVAEIGAKFAETHAAMQAAFAVLTAERLASPSPVSFAGAQTVADLLAFFAFHEAYHLGQVGFIRKNLGHSSLAG